MGVAKGTYLGGIRTPEDLRSRCCVDECTDCWHWRAGCSGNGKPSVQLVLPTGERVQCSGRRAALLVSGVHIPKGMRAIARAECRSADCVNPEHTKAGTLKQQAQYLARMGRFSTPQRRAQLMQCNDKMSKTTRQERLDIMLSDEPTAVLAERYGLTRRRVCAIRRNGMPPPIINSVFSLGG